MTGLLSITAPIEPVHGGLTGEWHAALYEHPRMLLASMHEAGFSVEEYREDSDLLMSAYATYGASDGILDDRCLYEDAQDAYTRIFDGLGGEGAGLERIIG